MTYKRDSFLISLTLLLLTLIFVEQAPRKTVQSYLGFAVQRYMLLLGFPNSQPFDNKNKSVFILYCPRLIVSLQKS